MTYVHHVPGRLRIRSEGVKRDPSQKALKEWLESLEGIERVDVSPVTGSVLIRYCVGAIDGSRLPAMMRDRGWIAAPAARPTVKHRSNGVRRALTKMVARHLAEIVIERCLVALVAAVL